MKNWSSFSSSMKIPLTTFRILFPIAPVLVGFLMFLNPDQSPLDPEPTGLPTEGEVGIRDPLIEEIRWERYLRERPRMAAHRKSLLKVAGSLPLGTFKSLSPEMQIRLAEYAERRLDSSLPGFSMCWAPGVSPEVIGAFHAVEAAVGDEPGDPAAATQFDENDRWSRTATFSEGREQGKPTILRWSFIPDGTSIFGYAGEPTADSDLVSFLDARYGVIEGGADLTSRPWFSVFETAFENVSNHTGISYVYEPNDDRAPLTENFAPSGFVNVRGDIRIGGHYIDGQAGSNTLAYNFYPNAGDMVIDTGNTAFYGDLSATSLNLRNVVEHEHGHGLGLSHVCPLNQTKLMEPFISRSFRGLQLDDIFSLNRLYGDFYEKHNTSRDNDSTGNAAPLSVTIGTPFSREYLSIDDDSDEDFFLLEEVPSGTLMTCRVIPVSTPADFVEGPQNANGSCSAGTSFDFNAIHDLEIALLSSDGSTVLIGESAEPAGELEEIVSFAAPATGNYFLRVRGDSTNNSQLYTLEIALNPAPDPPIPPDNLLADLSISGVVALSWSDNSDDELGFKIERKLEEDGTWTEYDTVSPDEESYQDLNPVPGINLFYRVSALGAGSQSDPSAEEIKMVVDLAAESYRYDFGGTGSPLGSGAFRVSPQTEGDVSWSGLVTSLDRGGLDPVNRDYLYADTTRTWSHRIANGVWEVNVRQGDESAALEDLTITAEGELREGKVDTAVDEFIESVFLVHVEDGSLDLTFDDLGGASDLWVVNQVKLTLASPYRSWAFLENLPAALDDPGQDADVDGIANVQEYYFGLSPLLGDSAIVLNTSPGPDDSKFLYTFLRDPAATVDLLSFESSVDLVTWIPFTPLPEEITTAPVGDLEEVTLKLSRGGDQRYIRVGVDVTEE